MKRRSAPFVVVALCLMLTSAVRAQRQSYFPPAAVDPVKLLPDFPAADSDEAREELKLMLIIQHQRTPADVARCAAEAKLSVDAFQSVLGPWCTSKNLPQLAKFFEQVSADAKPFSNAAKKHFHRPRPATEDALIEVPIEKDTSYSYPSGHSIRGTLYAEVLAEIAPPEHRDAILERGREIGWDRVIAGLHHPSDIYAGRVLGQALAEALLADPKFKDELPTLKKELADAERHAAEPKAEPVGAAR